MSATVRVYFVIWFVDESYSGPAGDGSIVSRFGSKAEAERFAVGKRYYSGPAEVQSDDVPRKLARRWGVA